VWIVAVYATRPFAVAMPVPGANWQAAPPENLGPLLPVMVVVPEAMVKVALNTPPWLQLPLSEKVPG
jgi:hypothetical protein